MNVPLSKKQTVVYYIVYILCSIPKIKKMSTFNTVKIIKSVLNSPDLLEFMNDLSGL